MSIIPKVKELKQAMKMKESKENIVFRIVLDVLGAYWKEYDGPHYKVFKNSLYVWNI